MFSDGFYKGKSESEIVNEIIHEGFDPVKISNTPGFTYYQHKHPEKKMLAFLFGGMDVTIEHQTYHCKPGDKVLIEGNTQHSAVVGDSGCIFFWSEKL